jgi:hypothetical protein
VPVLPRLIEVRLDLTALQERALQAAFASGFGWGVMAATLLVVLALLWRK